MLRRKRTDADVREVEEQVVSLAETQKAQRAQFIEWHAEMQKGTQAGLVVLFELEKKQLLQQVQVVELRIEIEQRCLEESSPSEDYLFSYEQHTNQLSDELLQMAQLQYLLNTEITFLRGFLTSIDAVDDSGNIKTLLLNMDERYFPLFKSEENEKQSTIAC